ncbi:sigma-70 family RNA polymerase sigma factor [Streptomyces sp. NPDC058740]|uniref:sigma-70 family RNA polymerase sigma factor n=1 Tax=Streptomyces sp. NPDC058740 TaxID=3346619 RepID=UPI003689F3CC
MGHIDADHVGLVVAAQAGDDRAREQLVAAYLPLLYNIAGRALDGHADVDDVVQETLLRVVRDLPALRAPESFRSWLVSITIRQINTHWQRRRTVADRTTGIDEAHRLPAAGAEPVDVTILRLHVSDERRRVVEAGRWLDPDHRMLLSLWWQECTGLLGREDMAAATGLTVAHVGVRLQRMREQLELCRTLVAALEADPRCPGLDGTLAGWDGQPASVWRKRMARHTRGCPVCTAPATAPERIPAELLPLSLTALAVPAGLVALLTAKGLLSGTAAGTAGLAAATSTPAAGTAAAAAAAPGGGLHGALGGKLPVVSAHPLASLATVAVLVAGAATYAAWPEPAHREPGVTAAPTAAHPAPLPSRSASRTPSPTAPSSTGPSPTGPSPTGPPPPNPSAPAGTVPLGTRSLESVDRPGLFVASAGDFATLGGVDPAGDAQARRRVVFTVVEGLADPRCVTFRAADGRYLRHHYLRLRLSGDDGSRLFREDATFCPRPGAVAGSVTLHAHNYPGSVLRHRDDGIWLDGSDGTRAFAGQASFVVRAPRA